MATKTYYFPSSTGTFTLPNGAYRISIFYTEGVADDGDDTNLIPEKSVGLNLDMPFEITPSSQTFEFPSMKFRFPNIDNIFESPDPVFDKTNHEFNTFITLRKDGADFWYGIIDYTTIKKTGWYLDGSTWKYRYIEFTALDRMAYFWWNPTIDMEDVGFSADDYFYNWFTDIFGYIGISSISYDSNIAITETCGTNYDYAEMRADGEAVDGYFKDIQVYKVLKNLMLFFGLFIYNYNGTVSVVRRISGSTTSIASTDIKSMEKEETTDPIDYIKLSSQKNYSSYADTGDYLHSVSDGSSGVESNRKFEITDADKFLSHIYVDYDGASTVDYPASPGGEITDSNGTSGYLAGGFDDFYTNDIEPGHRVIFDKSGGGQGIGIIMTVPSSTTLYFIPGIGTPLVGGYYWIDRSWASAPHVDDIYKIHSVLTFALAAYKEWFQTSETILKIKLKSISTYIALHNRLVIESVNWRVQSARINFVNDDLDLELRRVA